MKETVEPKKKRAPRTPKEKAFAKEYIANGGNGTQAALKVYDVGDSKKPNETAAVIAYENLNKLNIAEHFEKVTGLRVQDRLMALVDGLTAEKVNEFTGETRADYAARYKFLELTFKLDGSLKNAETLVQNNTQVNLQPVLVKFLGEE